VTGDGQPAPAGDEPGPAARGGGPHGPPLVASPPPELLADAGLLAELARARAADLVGPGDPARHLAHAWGFAAPLPPGPALVVDLGTGGGLPGLVLAWARPDWRLLLVDSAARRCRHLAEGVDRLGLGDRVEVRHARAEELGRSPLRGTADAVVARSFGPPAVVVECAAPLLRVGGRLVVSEPPEAPDRWPAEPLAALGLARGSRWEVDAGAHGHFGYQVLEQVAPSGDRYPRRPGMPSKRPLF
jgi:16S rRNA (guanine527-N7)-methyltransferase